MAVLQIKLYLAQNCADSRAVFDALPIQLVGWSYCAQYWLVRHGQVLHNLNRFEYEQMPQATAQTPALNLQRFSPGEAGASLTVEHTPAIELQGQVFTGAQALTELGAYLQQTLL